MLCPKCNKDKKKLRSYGPKAECPACYIKRYRATSKGKKAAYEANKRYLKTPKGKEKRQDIYERYRYKVGYYTPHSLFFLRWASKRLEKALATASLPTRFRQPSKSRSDSSLERENRHRKSESLRGSQSDSNTGNVPRSNSSKANQT